MEEERAVKEMKTQQKKLTKEMGVIMFKVTRLVQRNCWYS
jgi:hypothetical protein